MENISNFFNTYLLYVIICAVTLVVLIALIIVICVVNKHKKNAKIDQEINQTIEIIVNALGGKTNITKAEAKGSRLNVSLVDYTLLDEEKIKAQGVSSIIKMSTKVTLVVGSLSEEIAKYINK